MSNMNVSNHQTELEWHHYSQKQSSCRLTVMEAAMQVALTGLVRIPFTPRTPFET
ncbi:hypothetical protein DY78_GL001744 [Lactiplantibacillus fabifermentans DSM 21115]|uniref:Uncharacterized protein n=1 Tax=Lactiplantibacillus fabifermentans DSM 21115 TaxID=1413187 RepID=A0A0R2NGJ4_9LACO|nr:hypothetical protein DY78_GL001744 [Lactiplantibacillus fabifermentans DSM 21115]